MAKKESGISFIGQNTKFHGDIKSRAKLIVEGIIKGNIQCQEITITPSGKINGDLKTGIITVSGSYTGNLVAHRIVTVTGTGSVEGSVFTPSLVVEEGGLLNGDIKVMDTSAVQTEFPMDV